MAKTPIGGTLGIEVHLKAEAAAALKSLGHKLERDVAELHALYARAKDEPARVEEYAERRKQVEYTLWKMTVQREAMGLTHHGVLEELYGLPPRLG